MPKRKRRLVLLLLTIAAGGLSLWAFTKLRPTGDDLQIVGGPDPLIRLVTRREALSEALIDVPLPWGGSFTYPKHETQWDTYLLQMPEVSGVLQGPEGGRGYFSTWQLMVDGLIVDQGDPEFGNPNDLDLPYAYGDKPKLARLRRNREAEWIELRLPPNGKLLSKTSEQIKLGEIELNITISPPLVTTHHYTFEFLVKGPKKGQEYTIGMSSHFWPHLSNTLLCGLKPGIVYTDAIPEESVEVEITPVERRQALLSVTRTDKGGKSFVKIYDPAKELLLDVEFDRDGYSSSGGLNSFVVEGSPFSTIVREVSADENDWFELEFLSELKHGQTISAVEYRGLKDSLRTTVDFRTFKPTRL